MVIKVFMLYHLVFYLSYFGYSQTAAVRVAANQFPHPGKTFQSRDWIFSVFEDSKSDFVSSCYTTVLDPVSGKDVIIPSMLKTDKDLNPLWIKSITYAFDASGRSRSILTSPDGFSGALFDGLEFVDPATGKTWYVAIGYAKIAGINSVTKLIIVKVDSSGQFASGFPRVYLNSFLGANNNDSAKERRVRGVVYDPNEKGTFYLGGSQNQIALIYKLNRDLDFISLNGVVTMPTPLNLPPPNYSFRGDLRGICFQYQYGALPNGKPKPQSGGNPINAIWATGLSYDDDDNSNAKTDSNIIMARVLMDFTTVSAVEETSPAPPIPTWSTGGAPWDVGGTAFYTMAKNLSAPAGSPACSTYFHHRTGADFGSSIIQTEDKQILVVGLANIRFDRRPGICMGALDNPLEWTDADVFARKIEPALFPNSGYGLDAKHIGHVSGMDFFIRVNQDYNTDLYFTGSNGDNGMALLDSNSNLPCWTYHYVIKTKKDFTPLWNQTYYGGQYSAGTKIWPAACGFAATICKNNDLLIGGDNKIEADNYDLVRLSNDCAMAYSGYSTHFAPGGTAFSFGSDGVTLRITGIQNVTDDLRIKGRIVIENGGLLNITKSKLEFANLDHLMDMAYERNYRYGIEVKPGGRLLLNNTATLTSLNACKSFWRGVNLQANASPDQNNSSSIGILEMTNSRIENAICGVTVDGGGLITCSNTVDPLDNNTLDLDMVNFLNSRKGVAFYPFSPTNKSRFNFTNFSFESPYAVKDFNGIGLNTHCSMYGVSKIIFNGCSFKNTYTGPYRIGIGLASFDANFQVLRGNNTTTQEGCAWPTGKVTVFQNLTYGILSDKTAYSVPFSPSGFIGVGEAEFVNCATGWRCDNDAAPLSYLNTYRWDDELENYPMPYKPFGLGMWLKNTNLAKIHENTFTTDQNYPVGKGIAIENDAAFAYQNMVKNNSFQTIGSTSSFNFGVYTDGDNRNFDLRCNTFDLAVAGYDWNNQGPMKDQGSANDGCLNNFNVNTHTQICSPASTGFNYFEEIVPNNNCTPWVNAKYGAPTTNCNPLQKCDVYNQEVLNNIFEFEFENIEAPFREETKVWKKVKELNYQEAKNLINDLNSHDYKTFFNTIIPILESKRLNRPTPQEVEILKDLANSRYNAGIDAFHFLNFFLVIPINPPRYAGFESSGNQQLNKNTSSSNVSIIPNNISLFSIYPNPTAGLIYLELNNAEQPLTFEIWDVTGKLISKLTDIKPNSKHVIDVKS